ncbi:MAG: hypothetical protein WBD16_07590 [Pyrinomonadaceae bacterium]
MNLKKLFLYASIASVAVSALIGIGVMIFGSFGEFETKVLLTTMTVTITSILGLACGACLEARKGSVIPMAGIVFAVISAVLWMFMIWSEFRPESDTFARSVMSATLLAASCSLVSLLSLATLDRRFMWSRWLAHAAVWSLTALILWIIWAKIDPSDSWIARTMGVLSIIVAAVTVVTPVFHYLSSSEKGVDAIDAEIEKLRAKIAELETQRSALGRNNAKGQT